MIAINGNPDPSVTEFGSGDFMERWRISEVTGVALILQTGDRRGGRSRELSFSVCAKERLSEDS